MNHRFPLFVLVVQFSFGVLSYAQTNPGEFAPTNQSPDSTSRYKQNNYLEGIATNPLEERDALHRRQDDFDIIERPTVSRIEGSRLYLDNCTVHFIDDIKLPALESGQIVELKVREGDPVRPNELLGRIDDKLFKLQRQQYEKAQQIASDKANDGTAVLVGESESKLKEVKYDRAVKLGLHGSRNQSDIEEAQFELTLAILRTKKAENDLRTARSEAELEKAKIAEVDEHISRLQLFVDFEGYVIELLKQKLEWANAGDPVLRIGRMDRLSVHAIVETAEVNPHQIRKGQNVLVTLKMAGGQTEQFQGQIASVAHVRDTGRFFKIKAEIDNRRVNEHSWLLQPLSIVSMVVEL